MSAKIIQFPRQMPAMTYAEAMHAGREAASERARKAGRSKWSRGDYNHAVKVFDDLYGRAYRSMIGVEG